MYQIYALIIVIKYGEEEIENEPRKKETPKKKESTKKEEIELL